MSLGYYNNGFLQFMQTQRMPRYPLSFPAGSACSVGWAFDNLDDWASRRVRASNFEHSMLLGWLVRLLAANGYLYGDERTVSVSLTGVQQRLPIISQPSLLAKGISFLLVDETPNHRPTILMLRSAGYPHPHDRLLSNLFQRHTFPMSGWYGWDCTCTAFQIGDGRERYLSGIVSDIRRS
jgi:hypothetical protein